MSDFFLSNFGELSHLFSESVISKSGRFFHLSVIDMDGIVEVVVLVLELNNSDFQVSLGALKIFNASLEMSDLVLGCLNLDMEVFILNSGFMFRKVSASLDVLVFVDFKFHLLDSPVEVFITARGVV